MHLLTASAVKHGAAISSFHGSRLRLSVPGSKMVTDVAPHQLGSERTLSKDAIEIQVSTHARNELPESRSRRRSGSKLQFINLRVYHI
jgi:hypothetical protein